MPSRGHGKERQMDYEGVNTSFGRDVAVYFVCHRHGHFARECPEITQRCRRNGGGRQSFGSDQCHQSRGQVNRNFRGSGVQSFGGPRFGQPCSQAFGQQVSRTVYQPLFNDVEVGDLILLMIVRQPVQFDITAVARVT